MPPITNPSSTFEILKLIVSGLTPLLVIIIGLSLNKKLKKFEHRQWRNQKLIEKRLSIYDELAPLFNDLLCYFTFVGNWKESTPIQIIGLKRIIDKKVYLAAPLFCNTFFSTCTNFMELCYETYTGWGKDAKLKTIFDIRQAAFGSDWNSEWNDLFDPYNRAESKKVIESYYTIMNIFSKEIGLQDHYYGSPE